MSLLKKVIITLIFLFLAFITVCFVLSNIYEKEIIQRIEYEVNKNYKNEVRIDHLNDISLLKSFPNLSITAEGVIIYEFWSNPQISELANIHFAHIEVDIWELFQNQIVFPVITIEDANFYLKKHELWGYNFMRSESKSQTKSFINLEKIKLKDVYASWINIDTTTQDTLSSLNIQDIILHGRFSDSIYDVALNGVLSIKKHPAISGLNILNQSIYINSSCNVNTKQVYYDVKQLYLSLNHQLELYASGYVDFKKDLKFQAKIPSFSLSDALLYISDSTLNKLQKEYSVEGQLSATMQWHYDLLKLNMQNLEAQISLQQGHINHDSLNIEMEGLSASAVVRYEDSVYVFYLDALKARVQSGNIELNGRVNNILNIITSRWTLNVQNLSIPQVMSLYPIQDLTFQNGFISGRAEWHQDTLNSSIYANLEIQKLDLAYKNQAFNEIEVNAILKDNFLKINTLKGNIQGHGFYGSGDLSLDSSNQQQQLFSLNIEELDMTPFLNSNPSSTINTDTALHQLLLPKIMGNIQVRKLVYKDIKLSDLMLKIETKHDQIYFPQVQVRGFKGYVTGYSLITWNNNQVKFDGQYTFSNIDIHQLFEDFGNFSQNYITHRHLYGTLNGNIEFSIPFQQNKPILQKLTVNTNLNIEQGKLDHFEPLQELCQYIQKKKLYAAFIDYKMMSQKFETIKFATLSNQLFIRNGRLAIPKMKIASSALNLDIQGIHMFNDSIDYQLDFYLSDLLKKKEATLEDGVWEIKKNNRKWLKTRMGMNGTTENPNFFIRKEETLKSVQDVVNQEKTDLKSMLKSDFGLFKNDTSITPYTTPKNTIDFEFTHPEFKKESPSKPVQEVKKEKPSIFNTTPNVKEKEEYNEE